MNPIVKIIIQPRTFNDLVRHYRLNFKRAVEL
jgi:hypothetical protein